MRRVNEHTIKLRALAVKINSQEYDIHGNMQEYEQYMKAERLTYGNNREVECIPKIDAPLLRTLVSLICWSSVVFHILK